MITKKEFFKSNHLTHLIIACGIGFTSGFAYCFRDVVSGISVMVTAISIGLIVWFAGSDYYKRRLDK